MQFYPILGKKCNLWKLRKRFFAHKELNKGQVKGGIQMAKRGENIHKRKDGRWEGRYIKGRTAEGKPVWGYLYGYAYSEVREELIKQKALSGFYQLSGKSMHFSELAALWLTALRQSVKESTYVHYQYTLHKYFLPVLGSLPVSSMTDSCWNVFFFKFYRPQTGATSHLAHPRHRNVLGCCGESASMLHICTSCRPSRYASNCHTHRNQNHNP